MGWFVDFFKAVKLKFTWITGDGHDSASEQLPRWKRMPFNETFRESLLCMNLSQHAKKIILMRYVELVLDIKHKHISVMRSYNLLRLTTLLSGLVTPVLFSIQNDVPNSAALFWITLVTSLMGSISNAWLEFFSIIKLHYTYLSVSEGLEREGWLFSSLSGPYKKFDTHSECWQLFIKNTEKMHLHGVNQYMVNSQPQNRGLSGKEVMRESGVWKNKEPSVDSSRGSSTSSASSDIRKRLETTRMRRHRRHDSEISQQASVSEHHASSDSEIASDPQVYLRNNNRGHVVLEMGDHEDQAIVRTKSD